MTSRINPYELGQARPSDGWIVSDWAHFSAIMDWSAGNVRADGGGVRLTLDGAPAGAAKPYEGGEIQSDAVAATGTFTWVARAPEMVPGAVFGLFAFQEDHRDPRQEFDFEFIKGSTRQVWIVVHMAGPDGEAVSSPGRFIDLGFDAAEGFHTYQTVVTAHREAAFLVDGRVLAYFSAADLPGGAWGEGPMRSFANLWGTDRGWAGGWSGLDEPLVGTLLGADVRPGVYAGIGQVDGTAGADRIGGTAAHEIIRGEGGHDALLGAGGRDFLRGGNGRDVLDGGPGEDRLEGGAGDDTYLAVRSGDAVVELAGGGRDQVRSPESHALAPHVEDLLLTGPAAANGRGNDEANRLMGNAGRNALKGGGGEDLLKGGGGRDRLDGGAGDDRLWGNAGADNFRFSAGRDRVLDFRDDVDTILFNDALWGGGPRTAAQILDHATLSNGKAVFDFGGGDVLVVDGVGRLEALADDLRWF